MSALVSSDRFAMVAQCPFVPPKVTKSSEVNSPPKLYHIVRREILMLG
jgi:hypothetical protein